MHNLHAFVLVVSEETIRKYSMKQVSKNLWFLSIETNKTWTQTLDLDRGLEKPEPRKTWTLKNLVSEKSRP